MVICLERGADLQLMPLPLTVCFSEIQIVFTFLVPAHLGSPGLRAVKLVCVCVCVVAVEYLWYALCTCVNANTEVSYLFLGEITFNVFFTLT